MNARRGGQLLWDVCGCSTGLRVMTIIMHRRVRSGLDFDGWRRCRDYCDRFQNKQPISFDDDKAIVADEESELQKRVSQFYKTSARFGLKISTSKTETQCISRQDRGRYQHRCSSTQPSSVMHLLGRCYFGWRVMCGWYKEESQTGNWCNICTENSLRM
jgi:hypothetical protein